jgi:hypothetical protein
MAYTHETKYETYSLQEYAEDKIWMLEEEFCMKLSKGDIKHMYELPTKDAIDAFCRKLFKERL